MSTLTRWRRVDGILARALDLEGAQRAAFLSEACGEDRSLRAEVEALLAIDAAPFPLLDAVQLHAMVAPPERVRGHRLGRYELIEPIGEGGMGRVFLAVRADGKYQRRVAIKVLRRSLLTAPGLRRFRNECRVLAGLEHDGIARLYDAGSAPGGLPYLVMEHVEGERLDHFWRRSSAPLGARLQLFRAICDAVSHAHQHLVVHRDLKPANILVTADGKPKLLDFGIAKVLRHDDDAARADLTVGPPPMTPRYASPEQVAGEAATTASDVYALGLILGELLITALGHEAATEEAASASARPFRDQHLAPLPADLQAIVRRATAVQPEARYASAERLSEEIGRYLAGLPIAARPPTRRYRLRRFVGRHTLGVTVGAALAAAVTFAAVGFALLSRELAAERDRARIESQTSGQVRDFLVSLFAQAEPENRAGTEPTASEMLRRGAARIETAFSDSPPTVAMRSALLDAIGQAFHELSRYDEALPVREERLRLARLDAGGTAGIAAALLQVAETEEARSSLERAEALAREALAMLPDSGDQSLLRARAQRILGNVLARKGDLDAAEPLLLAVAEASQARFGARSEPAGDGYRALADLAFERRDAVSSERYAAAAHAAYRSALGAEHPRTLETLGSLAIALQNQGRLDEALARYRDLLARQQRVFGDHHVIVAQTLNSLATTHYDRGDLPAAEAAFRASLDTLRRLAREPTLEIAGVIINLARSVYEAGRIGEAIPLYREALGIFRSKLEPASPSLGTPLTFLGGALCTEGAVGEGEALLEEARGIYVAALGPDHYRLALLDATRARCLVGRGKVDEAQALLRAAIDDATGHFGAEHRLVAKMRRELDRVAGLGG